MPQKVLHGIPVSAGISIGKAFFVNRSRFEHIPRQAIPAETIPAEVERLSAAFAQTAADLRKALDKVPDDLKEQASIINSHLMISADPKLMGAAKKIVTSMSITAEWALEKAVDDIARAFAAIEDTYIRERIQDVQLVASRVQAQLLRQARNDADPDALHGIQERVVLMAHDLSPADTIGLESDKIMSFATVQGGKTSHTGILGRSLQIPAVVGVSGLEESVSDGDLVIVDGLNGKIMVDPDESVLALYADLKYQFEAYQQSIMRSCVLPAETQDGFRIKVLANIELFEECTAALDNGGEGIGLYRTEYAFMNKRVMPDEEELFEEYRDLAAIMNPRQVIFRTLDIGADKVLDGQEKLNEANPAMGLRAIRYSLRNEELFRRQIRAILRASSFGNVSIMFPMISGLAELAQAKSHLRVVQNDLKAHGRDFDPDMPVGIMVELPSAVMIAEQLAKEVDFFSIGTNDLIQYSLGIDRTNKYVSYLYQPLHPAIVRSIKHVVDAAHREGIEVTVCGEVAADPYCVPILMGMQVDGLSIAPQAIPGIKRIIRQTSLEDCKNLLSEILSYSTVSKINRRVKETVFRRFPEELMFYSSLIDQEDA